MKNCVVLTSLHHDRIPCSEPYTKTEVAYQVLTVLWSFFGRAVSKNWGVLFMGVLETRVLVIGDLNFGP